MFKKKPNIKPLAPLKTSERRRIADQLIATLAINIPPEVEPDLGDVAISIASRTNLRNSLLPDNTLSAKFTATTGSGYIFVGNNDGEQRILWAKVGDIMYPTVYTLWHNAGIIPLLHTNSVVVESIQRGADLMTPGLACGPPFPEGATKGSLVAIASTNAPSVPIAVGTCEFDINKLDNVQGVKGHAIKVFHWFGDELWTWSSAGKPGKPPPEMIEGWLGNNIQNESIATHIDNLSVRDNEISETSETTGGALPIEDKQITKEGQMQGGNSLPSEDTLDDVVQDRELTTQEIDEAFQKAFLYGIRHFMDTNKDQPNFGLEFPLSQSFVMSTLVQPFLPCYTDIQLASMQIKKTSWKSIKKFIKYLDKRQIIKSKDRDGNEVVILDIDFDDQHVKDFVPYRLPKKESAASGLGGVQKLTAQVDPSDLSIGQKLRRIELYRPKEKISTLFSSIEADPRGFYTTAEIRSVMTSYIEKENLIPSSNKRLATLNPLLGNTLFDGDHPLDGEVLAKRTVPRDALVDRVIYSCNPFYVILRNNEQIESTKPKSGTLPKVSIVLETRGGNKMVTKVSGVEAYFIHPQPLADELRKACAGSTSVEQLKGSSPKIPVMEIMIQGPQKDVVTKALEKRGINKQWIDVTDKTKGKKRS